MPLPFRRLTPKLKRMPAHIHLMRLETSPLYQRREREAQQTAQYAKLKAIWYLASDFRPRFQ